MRLVSILAEMQKTHINLGFAASSRHQISGRGRSQARDPPEKAKSVQKLLSQVNSILSFQNQLFSFFYLFCLAGFLSTSLLWKPGCLVMLETTYFSSWFVLKIQHKVRLCVWIHVFRIEKKELLILYVLYLLSRYDYLNIFLENLNHAFRN